MRGKIQSMTFEQVNEIASKTDWERVRNEEPDMSDPDAPDFSETMRREVEKISFAEIPDRVAMKS